MKQQWKLLKNEYEENHCSTIFEVAISETKIDPPPPITESNTRRDVDSSCRSLGTFQNDPAREANTFYLVFCFLILPVWVDFSFW